MQFFTLRYSTNVTPSATLALPSSNSSFLFVFPFLSSPFHSFILLYLLPPSLPLPILPPSLPYMNSSPFFLLFILCSFPIVFNFLRFTLYNSSSFHHFLLSLFFLCVLLLLSAFLQKNHSALADLTLSSCSK